MERVGAKRIVLIAAAVLLGLSACASRDTRNEAVAEVNGETIKVLEVREFLGIRGGAVPASGITAERKMEALDRMITGVLLAQEARARGLDDTEAFRELVEQNEQGALIAALFRKETASKVTVSNAEVRAAEKEVREADGAVSAEGVRARAEQAVLEAKIRQIDEELVATAREEIPSTVHPDVVERIGKGEKVKDDAVLATVGGETVRYGTVKEILESLSGPHGGRTLAGDPDVVGRVVEREVTGKALAAYAKQQGIEGSEWMASVRRDMERAILIELLAGRIGGGDVSVTDKEVEAAYAEHEDMFVRDGKKVPLAMVREQIRAFLESEKKQKALGDTIEGLKGKARITVHEKALAGV
jgi:hypothetical protein